MNNLNFIEILARLRKETDLEKDKDLAKFVGVANSNISNRKRENNFSIEWAYLISKKYKLNIEWILEGIGPVRLGHTEREIETISNLEKWLAEYRKIEPGALIWFDLEVKRKFPEFADWLKKREDHLYENISAG
jgi:transcriptional regulator with XRE-family HTH domain